MSPCRTPCPRLCHLPRFPGTLHPCSPLGRWGWGAAPLPVGLWQTLLWFTKPFLGSTTSPPP